MAKVIVLIHGRSNKPAPVTLKDNWIEAIQEGLRANTSLTSLGDTKVEMAYYADLHYTSGPVNDIDNSEPYIEAKPGSIKRYKKGFFDRIRNLSSGWIEGVVDSVEEYSGVFSKLARSVAKKLLRDLGKYYSQPDFRLSVNNRLEDILKKHRDDEVILVSHSMGTIIAYEVLRDMGKTGYQIDHLITMGSPLGMAAVQGNMLNHRNQLRTPSCVKRSWVNFSDPGDYVCIDTHLADDYTQNSTNIGVKDYLVCNDYPKNEHKSYGYLRTPEFSEHLASLL
ncbi:alpha/beta hydrolase [Enterovibrio sp. ZSDZ42]|uniref:Alpha/beta hydrolase n=1 Tax=Enterovibrio gelatinilyticus TaxID=2899819 RepID=A0ABT5R792_9GAMM|nr:alpha/beta hydrolase [Enterovibrio sp. ZSDZ42]MDD1796147.1 alpha/beta hydrolase [Enterovibrio sp. ZSDZ42]